MFSVITSVLNVCSLSIFASCLFWFYATWNFDYWKKKRIPFKKPIPIFGNFASFALHHQSLHEVLHNLYVYFGDCPVGGFFEMREPKLLIKSPELVHSILVKDFELFYDRGLNFFLPEKELNPLSTHLFNVNGQQWRDLRRKLSPIFTSSKLRLMYEQILECIFKLNNFIDERMVNGSTEQDLKETYGRLTIDVIGSCAFGLDCNSLENNEFRLMASKSLAMTLRQTLTMMLDERLRLKFKLPDFSKDVTDFFMEVIRDTICYRRETGFVRNDSLQILMKLQNAYTDPKYASAELQKNISDHERFDEIDIVGNSFLLFLAGSETTATTISHCLYELAMNQNIQDELRAEVEAAYNEHKTMTFDMLKKLKYLNAVISETLRKYPPLPFLNRICATDYQIPNSDVTIGKGTKIFIPVWSIHHDEQNFKNPEVYDPSRFFDSNKDSIRPGTFIPFGDGPRNCIGAQFANMEIRAALADAMLKYHFTPCGKSEIPLTYKESAITLAAKNGVWVNITKRNT